MLDQPLETATIPKNHRKRTSNRKIKFKTWVPNDGDYLHTTATLLHSQRQQLLQKQQKEGTGINKPKQKSQDLLSEPFRYRCPSPLKTLPCNGIRQDPFIQLPIKATAFVTATLDYFITVVSPQELSRTGNVVDSALDHHLTLLFPFMIENTCLFQSIIAVCRCSILISLGRPPLNDLTLLYHRHQALSSLKECLKSAQCSSDANLLTISMLLTLDYLVDNIQAVSAHLAGLKQLAAMRTDLDDCSPWRSFVKRGLDAYESLGSFITGKAPDVPTDSNGFIKKAFSQIPLDGEMIYATFPFEPDLFIMMAELPSGFFEVCLTGSISIQTLNILAALTEVSKRCQTKLLCESRLATEPHVMFSILQRLSRKDTTSTEKYITLGLMAWVFQICTLKPLTMFNDPPLRTFIRLISTHEKPESIPEQECLCWISMAAAGALNLRSIRMPGTHLVLERLFAMYPLSRKWDTLELTLKKFLWNPIIGAHWKNCWFEGMQRRATVQARLLQQWESLLDEEPEVTTAIDTTDGFTLDEVTAHTGAIPPSAFNGLDTTKCPFLSRHRV